MSTWKFGENKFNQSRKTSGRDLKKIMRGEQSSPSPQVSVAGSDALGNAGFEVSFAHVPSDTEVSFKAFISSFQENYRPDWTSETTFGRPDALYMYKNTSRSISMSLKIPAASESEAFENLQRVQRLVQFLYPTYIDIEGANTISQSPLVRLKVMNLITDSSRSGDYSFMAGASNKNTWGEGLLGVIGNLAITHNLDNADVGVFEMGTGTILPKMIEINFDFQAIHEAPLGWSEQKKFSTPTFPYGVKDSAQLRQQEKETGEATTKPSQETVGAGGSLQQQNDRKADTGKEESESARENRVANYLKAKGAAMSTRRGARREKAEERHAAYESRVDAREARRDLYDNPQVVPPGQSALGLEGKYPGSE